MLPVFASTTIPAYALGTSAWAPETGSKTSINDSSNAVKKARKDVMRRPQLARGDVTSGDNALTPTQLNRADTQPVLIHKCIQEKASPEKKVLILKSLNAKIGLSRYELVKI